MQLLTGILFVVLGMTVITSFRLLGDHTAAFQEKLIKLLFGASVHFSNAMRAFIRYFFLAAGVGFFAFGFLAIVGLVELRG